jgi:hypothetical protein
MKKAIKAIAAVLTLVSSLSMAGCSKSSDGSVIACSQASTDSQSSYQSISGNYSSVSSDEKDNPFNKYLIFALREDNTLEVYSKNISIGASHLRNIVCEIPSSYHGIPVTSIGEYGFFEKAYGNLYSKFVIPSSIIRIGDRGLPYSKNEGFFNIKDNSKYLGNDDNKYLVLMNGNPSSESLNIDSSTRFINDNAFSYESILSSVSIPSSVFSIGYGAFQGCKNLSSITIPSSVNRIGGFAFSYCTSLTSVTIPSSVTSIENNVFSGCSSLASVTIHSSVTSIGDGTFSECSSLTNIAIPSSVTSIGWEAFSGCTSLASVTIPSSVTSIGDYAFSRCTSLASVTIPSSVTSIGDYAFSGCTSLASVTIPSSVTSIGDLAFRDCASCKIYCEAASKPSGWNEDWNGSGTAYWYSETSKTGCWHYVNGVPTLW